MRCDSCGQEEGHCHPSCPATGIVFIDEYLSRHSGDSAGSSPIDTGDAPADPPVSLPQSEEQPFGEVYDLVAYRKKKKEGQSDDHD